MRTFLRLAGLLVGLTLVINAHATLVTPPVVDWVSVPSTATVGQSVSVGAGGHGEYSDNSDGNNWNAGTMPYILRIIIDVQRPGQGWTNLHDWLGTWQTPASAWTSFTPNDPGTHYIRVQLMDGRPWYSAVYTYAIGVPNPAPTITSSLSVGINQGQTVSYNITATNSPTSYGAANLPSGLSVNTSTGAITGIIPANGGVQGSNSTINSTITATNTVGTDSKTLVWNLTAANIVANGSVSPSGGTIGTSVTLTRAGSANFGLAWTENVIWKPDGSAQVLGNAQLGSQSYTPNAGPGTYWYQFRVVDTYSNYKDQWISFVMTGSSPTGLQTTSVQSYSVSLSWNAVSGATGYNVYRNGVKLTGSPQTGTAFADSNLSAGTTYTYGVTAIVGGNESPQTTLNVTTTGSFEVFTPLP
ncbi:MAG: fibronectin type III domain-containing protein [Verrucomicrobiota bacterium]